MTATNLVQGQPRPRNLFACPLHYYLRLDAAGQPLDPCQMLPPLGEDVDGEKSIVDGTGAIRVCQDLNFRQEAGPKIRANREQLLKRRCRLDTAAMVLIWKHWSE